MISPPNSIGSGATNRKCIGYDSSSPGYRSLGQDALRRYSDLCPLRTELRLESPTVNSSRYPTTTRKTTQWSIIRAVFLRSLSPHLRSPAPSGRWKQDRKHGTLVADGRPSPSHTGPWPTPCADSTWVCNERGELDASARPTRRVRSKV